ncbi:MAG: hypothetical protein LH613_00090 [Chamaesiphon sp.]|nr:hypothetical protein [Chamaesiphon sp.]
MLKYLLVAGTTAIVNLVLVFANPVQIASAAIDPSLSIAPSSQDKLIIKDEKPERVNTHQQADIQNIRQTLTQFYRGMNEHSVDRMAKVAVLTSAKDKEYLRSMFARLKSDGVEMSVEVQNIELVSLSERNALVKVTQVMKAKGKQRAISSQQSASLVLVKYRGQWKISGSDTVMKSIDRDR